MASVDMAGSPVGVCAARLPPVSPSTTNRAGHSNRRGRFYRMLHAASVGWHHHQPGTPQQPGVTGARYGSMSLVRIA